MDDHALVIVDGGLGGLLACYTEGVCRAGAAAGSGSTAATPASSTPWLALTGPQADERPWRTHYARRAAEVCHMNDLLEWSGEQAAHTKPAGPALTAMLLAAGAEALRLGLDRVVWSIALGGDGPDDSEREEVLNAIADASDRALAAARLLSIDAGDQGLIIQTPYVDFGREQLADLAADVDLPLSACWLGRPGGDERNRWERALRAVGAEPPGTSIGGALNAPLAWTAKAG